MLPDSPRTFSNALVKHLHLNWFSLTLLTAEYTFAAEADLHLFMQEVFAEDVGIVFIEVSPFAINGENEDVVSLIKLTYLESNS